MPSHARPRGADRHYHKRVSEKTQFENRQSGGANQWHQPDANNSQGRSHSQNQIYAQRFRIRVKMSSHANYNGKTTANQGKHKFMEYPEGYKDGRPRF